MKKRKTLTGRVLSAKMPKTVKVAVERISRHPFYGRYMKRRVNYLVHDEKGACAVGDVVSIVETRPLSKEKRWRVETIVEKAK